MILLIARLSVDKKGLPQTVIKRQTGAVAKASTKVEPVTYLAIPRRDYYRYPP